MKAFVFCLMAIGALGGFSQTHASEKDAWAALREGGRAVLMLRHALAPGTGDPVGFVLGDCSTQRNLNDTGGREQARAWKAFLAEHGIDEARVFSSQWCRCLETAQEMNMGGPVTEWPALNSFFSQPGGRWPATDP